MTKPNQTIVDSLLSEKETSRRAVIKTIKSKANAKRKVTEKIADGLTFGFGSMVFLFFNSIFFLGWLLINTGNISSIEIFDPFPFSLLTTIVSLEAIILAIIVLISQNRAARVDDLREEIHLQVNLMAEKEITKIMKMVAILLEKHGVDLSRDSELKRLLKPISEEELEERLEKEIF